MPPPLEISAFRHILTPHKPPAQPCHSPKCMLHHTCCTLQGLGLFLQCPIAYPGLISHTLAGLCALWLPSAASSYSGNLHKPANTHPPQNTCPVLPQPPVWAPSQLLHTAEAAFDLTVPYGTPRAGHSHTGRALCAVVAEHCLLLLKSPQTGETATPTNHLPSSAVAHTSADPTTPAAHCRGCI